MITSIYNTIPGLINSDSSVNNLLGVGSSKNQSLDLKDVLSAAYGQRPTDVVDLSSGLKAFIEENVTDESQKAKLLASLDAINDLNAASKQTGDNTVSTLLGNAKNGGILNLFA
jgi:hypothetical protein